MVVEKGVKIPAMVRSRKMHGFAFTTQLSRRRWRRVICPLITDGTFSWRGLCFCTYHHMNAKIPAMAIWYRLKGTPAIKSKRWLVYSRAEDKARIVSSNKRTFG